MVIKGDLNLENCKNLVRLVGIKKIEGNLHLGQCSNLKSLGDLQIVGGFVDLNKCENFDDLGVLEEVGFWLDLKRTNVSIAKKLRLVGQKTDDVMSGSLSISSPHPMSLPELEYVQEDIWLGGNSKFASFPKLERVGYIRNFRTKELDEDGEEKSGDDLYPQLKGAFTF